MIFVESVMELNEFQMASVNVSWGSTLNILKVELLPPYISLALIYSLIGLRGINKRFVYCTCIFDTVYCLLNFIFCKFDFTKLYSDYIQYSHNCSAYNRSHMYQ